jgi:hypothetical protein
MSCLGENLGDPFIEIGYTTDCGWLRNPASVDRRFIPLFIGFQPSKVVPDFFHPQYPVLFQCTIE